MTLLCLGNQRTASENQKVMSLDRAANVGKLDNAPCWSCRGALGVSPLPTPRATWQQSDLGPAALHLRMPKAVVVGAGG